MPFKIGAYYVPNNNISGVFLEFYGIKRSTVLKLLRCEYDRIGYYVLEFDKIKIPSFSKWSPPEDIRCCWDEVKIFTSEEFET